MTPIATAAGPAPVPAATSFLAGAQAGEGGAACFAAHLDGTPNRAARAATSEKAPDMSGDAVAADAAGLGIAPQPAPVIPGASADSATVDDAGPDVGEVATRGTSVTGVIEGKAGAVSGAMATPTRGEAAAMAAPFRKAAGEVRVTSGVVPGGADGAGAALSTRASRQPPAAAIPPQSRGGGTAPDLASMLPEGADRPVEAAGATAGPGRAEPDATAGEAAGATSGRAGQTVALQPTLTGAAPARSPRSTDGTVGSAPVPPAGAGTDHEAGDGRVPVAEPVRGGSAGAETRVVPEIRPRAQAGADGPALRQTGATRPAAMRAVAAANQRAPMAAAAALSPPAEDGRTALPMPQPPVAGAEAGVAGAGALADRQGGGAAPAPAISGAASGPVEAVPVLEGSGLGAEAGARFVTQRPEVAPLAGEADPGGTHAAGVSRQIAGAVVEYRGAEAQVVLDPEELGQVRLTVSLEDGGTLIRIVAERPETAELMRRHADLLLQDLAGSGVPQARLSFASGGEAGGGREGTGRPQPPREAPGAGSHAAAEAEAHARPARRGLDMRV